jgi:hypothetical protein
VKWGRGVFSNPFGRKGLPKSMPLGKDKDAERDGDLRTVDESGEDFLYPGRYFAAIDVPKETERA